MIPAKMSVELMAHVKPLSCAEYTPPHRQLVIAYVKQKVNLANKLDFGNRNITLI